MIVFTVTLLLLASGLRVHTDLLQLDSVQDARRSLQSSSGIFTMLMVGDPQYSHHYCVNNPWRGTADYGASGQTWCDYHWNTFISGWNMDHFEKLVRDSHRINNYMNAVRDGLFSAKLNGRLPAGANILGDLTQYGWEDEKKDYESKIHWIQSFGPVRIWQSLGNHDTVNTLRKKDKLVGSADGSANNKNMRNMVQKMKELLPKWHGSQLGGKVFHDGVYHYDTESNSFLYKKGGIVFMNLQLHPAMHHIDYYCKSCHDHAGHYHTSKWKQVLFSPLRWFKERVQDIKNGNYDSGTPVKGIVLMYHYGQTNEKTNLGDETVDSARWTEVRDLMKDHNQHSSNYPPFIAVFNGHQHARCGYLKDNDLNNRARDTSRDIPRFYTGSADYNCFLTVEFSPNDEAFRVHANMWDNTNKPADADVTDVSSYFKRRCIHENGYNSNPSGCTEWKFDGDRVDCDQACKNKY